MSISKYNFSRSETETVLRSSVGGVKICSSGASVSAVYIAIGSMFSSVGNNALGDSFAFLTGTTLILLRLGFRRNFLSVLHPNLVSSPIKGILEIFNLTPRCIPMDILAWTDCVRSSAGKIS